MNQAVCSLGVVILTLIVTTTNAAAYPPIENATYIRCYDGDTCTFTIPGWPDLAGKEIGVRIRGLDTPEIRGKCEQEKALAIRARDRLRELLRAASAIVLSEPERGKYFRIVATVLADGMDVAEVLIAEGLARRYDGGHREGWC